MTGIQIISITDWHAIHFISFQLRIQRMHVSQSNSSTRGDLKSIFALSQEMMDWRDKDHKKDLNTNRN